MALDKSLVLGLDLQGGVSVTLEVDDKTAGPELSAATRTEKLAKAVVRALSARYDRRPPGSAA